MFNRYIAGPIVMFLAGGMMFLGFLMAGFASLFIIGFIVFGVLLWFITELVRAQFYYRATIKTRA